jgi:hypothetical protein
MATLSSILQSDFRGTQGVTGAQGTTGAQGATGAQGTQGTQGASAIGGINSQMLYNQNNVAVGATNFVYSASDQRVGIGTTIPQNTLTVVGITDIQGAVETVSIATTYQNVVGTNIIVECDASRGTVFTHSLANGVVGIMSFRNFPATKNSITTFTVLFTQNSTGTANTTAVTGIGTNIRLFPYGGITGITTTLGITTSARVSSASTITLPITANDVDIVTFAVHYNGAGSATTTNYSVYASDVSSFRFGNVKP